MDDIANDAEHAEKDELIRKLQEERGRLISEARRLTNTLHEQRTQQRDEFAKAALTGLIASAIGPVGYNEEANVDRRRALMATVAYAYADAMLKARG